MRRRRPTQEQMHPNVPRELLRFDAADWIEAPGEFSCEHASCRFWEALSRFQAEHPELDVPLPSPPPDETFHPEDI